ncbi:Pyridoxal phosphate homeostasis protein [Buchnera aphidicola (Thelaxes suberi)]|uniref:YggS family pyridoxal phosphate-dependent enzyme n=1 Tax=Buchnera aphidicola TaxID=9 RepID=UPI0034644919
MNNIYFNLNQLQKTIMYYALKYKKKYTDIKVIAISKKRSINEIIQAYSFGQRAFGENYVQEAIKKINNIQLKIEWHFVGKIQSNKVSIIAKNFAWCHSITSKKHAELLNKYRPEILPPLNVLIQININCEKNKNGIYLYKLMNLVNFIYQLKKIKLRGIMIFPNQQKDIQQKIILYKKMYIILMKLKNKYKYTDTLSLGTSYDIEEAIASGSNMLRIGQKIFNKKINNH